MGKGAQEEICKLTEDATIHTRTNSNFNFKYTLKLPETSQFQ